MPRDHGGDHERADRRGRRPAMTLSCAHPVGAASLCRAATALALLTAGVAAAPAWAIATTERVSVGPGSVQADRASISSAISADGRFVAFSSGATNLVPGDSNGVADIFVRDRQTGTTERVSVGPGGAQAIAPSSPPAISGDGRFVAFVSGAFNLVVGDTNRVADVFVRDRRTGTTERVSIGPGGAQANGSSQTFTAITPDGRFVAFAAFASNLAPGDTNNLWDIFVRDRLTARTERVSVGRGGAQANGSSYQPAIAAGGRFVAFDSVASNLVPGDTNGVYDLFVRDRQAGTTERVSVGPGGAQANGVSNSPAISADGRFVAFVSEATNLVPGDANGAEDVFLRDRRTGRTECVSLGRGNAQAIGRSFHPTISPGGRFVAFTADAANLVPGDTNGVADIFVRDRRTGRTERVSLGQGGTQAVGYSVLPSISLGGRFIAFTSKAGDLVPGDTNGQTDVFVRSR